MNIDGLSEATLMKMIEQGFLSELNDLYNLEQYKEQIIAMDGFGEKSYNNLMQSIEKSRDTQLFRFVYGIGILNVGSSNARLLCRHFGNSLESLRGASVEEMTQIDGIGEVIATSVHDYFENEHNQKLLEKLLPYLHFEEENCIGRRRAGTEPFRQDICYYRNSRAFRKPKRTEGKKSKVSVVKYRFRF